MHGIRRLALLLVSRTILAMLCPAAVATQLPTSHGTGRVVVHSPDGALRGTRAKDVDSFLGTRYAQPPTGRLRWAPPKPVKPWKGRQVGRGLRQPLPSATEH